MDQTNPRPMWRRVIAFLIDLMLAFFVFGYAIAALTGRTTEGGFELNGIPAILVIVLVIAYFVLMNRYAGGTLGKRIMKIR